MSEVIQVINPASGWIQNCNSTPFTVSGPSSPLREKYPAYMAPDFENPRGIHAVKVLSGDNKLDINTLVSSTYDPWLPGMQDLVPSLTAAYDALALTNDTLRTIYAQPVQMLKGWDYRFSTQSIPMTLAITTARMLRRDVTGREPKGIPAILTYLKEGTSPTERVKALAEAVADLKKDF